MSILITIISFIIVFGVLVTVHEYGHMFFAKRAGIMCPEFAIGMGPKILVFVKMKHYIQFVYYRWVVMSGWLVMVLKNHQFNQV